MPEAKNRNVIGIGEVLWDCFPDQRRPGGAPANVAYHAQQLGCNAAVCSRVGNDNAGRELAEYLREHGLRTDLLQTDDDRPTGYVTVDVSVPKSPSYIIHENVAWDAIAFDRALEDAAADAAAVCFGTLAQRTETSRETIRRTLAAARDALVIYDVNLRQTWYQRDWVEQSMRAAHLIKLNGDEVEVLAGLLDVGDTDPARFATAMRERYAVETTCVTRGARGCMVFTANETVEVAGVQVEVMDTVGAGDSFTGALTANLLRGWPMQRAATFANRVGALVAARSGAMPDIGAELQALIDEFEG